MRRLTMLFVVTALVLPGAANAAQQLTAPDRDPGTRATFGTVLDKHGIDQAAAARKASAVAQYYASYGKPKPLPAPAQAPAPAAGDGNGLSWTLAIGAGIVLMLVAGGLGVYAGRMVRPRHIGA
jgi:hypothetical protein